MSLNEKLNLIMNQFPDGMYWNHRESDSTFNIYDDNPDSVTNYPCTHHGNYCDDYAIEYNHYVCNSYGGGSQCYGFALYMGFKLFNQIPVPPSGPSNGNVVNGWKVYSQEYISNVISLEPGDIIRVEETYINSDGKSCKILHSAIVWKVENGVLFVGEVWGSESCKIAWGYFNGGSYSSIYADYIKQHAKYILKAPHIGVTITFDKNFANSTPITAVCVPGEEYGDSMPIPMRSHYRFDGWYTTSSGGDKFTSSTNVPSYDHTLYAHWTYMVNVTFNMNYSGGGSSQVDVEPGIPYGNTMFTPTRTHYRFDGWYTTSTGGTKFTSSTNVPSYDHTLYAHWTYMVNVTFNSNYSGGGSSSETFIPGEPYGAAMFTPTRTHYRFDGWYTTSSGGDKFTSSTNVPSYDHTLYAHWTYMVNVTFNMNYSGGGSSQVDVEPGIPYGNTMFTPTRTHYRFDGWYTTSTGGTKFTSSTNVPSYDHTLYAHWTYMVNVTFNMNYSDGDSSQVAVEPGEAYGDAMFTPTRTHYRFDGWYTTGTGGTKFTSSTNVPSYDHTLYAHWKQLSVVQFCVDDEESVSFESKICCIGEPYGELPIACKNGNTFIGWRNSSGVTVTCNTIVTTGDHSLYAMWS